MQLSLKINATFAENKCNFLALLLQQKLALVIRKGVVNDTKNGKALLVKIHEICGE